MRVFSASLLLLGASQVAAFVPHTLAPLRATTLQQQQHNGPLAR